MLGIFFLDSPSLDAALTSDFPQDRYSDGLIGFLCVFQGLLPRVPQRPNMIIFEVCRFSGLRNRLSNTDFYAGPHACTRSHQIPSASRPSLRRPSTFATVVQSQLLSDG